MWTMPRLGNLGKQFTVYAINEMSKSVRETPRRKAFYDMASILHVSIVSGKLACEYRQCV